ncbi:MAG: hypothetical protein CSA55_02970 [Ilumatobacter coccineus]|uniref:Uncharacterized protein n=1 Tax=Ilumatobacter coccineus TaxID=467094 RepID=A0A2G6KAK9_9ACTN|nr:MAG: hypothetical protein CSA55_02970 [Ilumatobacter coccineus]
MSIAAAGSKRSSLIIIGVDLVLTMVFVGTAIYAAVVNTTSARWVGVIGAMVTFAVGVVAAIWSYSIAYQISQTREVLARHLYLLIGHGIPHSVKRVLNSALAAQILVAVATMVARPTGPDGSPGTSLAVGCIVPVFGLGMNAWWVISHVEFAPRRRRSSPSP